MKKHNKRAQKPRVKKPQLVSPKKIPMTEAIEAAKLYAAMGLACEWTASQAEGEVKALFTQAMRLAVELVSNLENARPGAQKGMQDALDILKRSQEAGNEEAAAAAE